MKGNSDSLVTQDPQLHMGTLTSWAFFVRSTLEADLEE